MSQVYLFRLTGCIFHPLSSIFLLSCDAMGWMDVNQIAFRFSPLTMQASRDPEVRLGQSVSGLRPRPQYVYIQCVDVFVYVYV